MSTDRYTFGIDDRELQRALKNLERRAGLKVSRRALRSGARIVAAEARVLVPVRTGRLKRSIKIKQRTRRGNVEMRVVATVPYAHLVELGVKPHAQPKRHRRHPGATARPFLRPALDMKAGDAVAITRSKLAESIEKTKG